MPDADTINSVAQLGSTAFTVFLFIGYLIYKNGKSEKAMQRVADTLDKLHRSQEVHTRVLMRVARQHGQASDADDLMMGRE